MKRMTAGVVVLAVSLSAGIAFAQEMPTLADVMAEVKALRADVDRLEEQFARGLQQATEDYQAENKRLRFKVDQLERERDFVLNEVEAENERLRRELRQTYRDYGLALPSVPTPDRALLSDVLGEDTPPLDRPYETELADRIEAVAAPTEPTWEPVAEWGRTPEEAAALGEDVLSLKGMIAVVPVGADEAYLAAAGRMLRQQFDAYDNINVELFDDAAAAQDYKSSGVAAPEHRVMSVSRHRESGRDVILILQGETALEVPPGAAEVPLGAAEDSGETDEAADEELAPSPGSETERNN